jgi:rare lipoprotein A
MRARAMGRLAASAALVAILLLGASGCHHKVSKVQPPPQGLPPAPAPTPTATLEGVSPADLEYVQTHRPILSETGYATWYTAAPGRHSANGQLFSDRTMTAANRTLPMGSLVEVTNLKTGESGIMRITDRGPFVEGRMIDLTIASAKATGIYRAGLAQVRMDVYETPEPIDEGGRWCVQIGAFHEERAAIELKEQLLEIYPGAKVIEFPGEKSWWVRIRPQGDDRATAEYIQQHVHPSEGNAFLTRLD